MAPYLATYLAPYLATAFGSYSAPSHLRIAEPLLRAAPSCTFESYSASKHFRMMEPPLRAAVSSTTQMSRGPSEMSSRCPSFVILVVR